MEEPKRQSPRIELEEAIAAISQGVLRSLEARLVADPPPFPWGDVNNIRITVGVILDITPNHPQVEASETQESLE